MLKISIAVLAAFVLIGCGGGGSGESASNVKGNVTELVDKPFGKLASNNLNRPIEQDFNGYKIRVYIDKKLSDKEELSKETKALYGYINGQNTKALLKINKNYKNTLLQVKVYKNSKLVGESKKIAIGEKEIIYFGKIDTLE